MESVLAENESGPETIAEVTCPVPLPVKSPPSVVEPVPPKEVAMVVVAMTLPCAFANKIELVMLVIARLVVVACWRDVLPETVREELALSAPPTFRTLLMVVEPVTANAVVVAPAVEVAPVVMRPPLKVS